jgi:hypothetical protein
MRRAAEPLRGQHDFHSFETEWPNRQSSVQMSGECGGSRGGRVPGRAGRWPCPGRGCRDAAVISPFVAVRKWQPPLFPPRPRFGKGWDPDLAFLQGQGLFPHARRLWHRIFFWNLPEFEGRYGRSSDL